LRIWAHRPAAVWAFDPLDSQPSQVVHHGLHELWAAALRIQIFVAKDQLAMMLGGALCRDPEGAGVAEMEQARGGGGETSAVEFQMGIVWHEWSA
jgi:hypothetical protein